jgi:CheY-like chemotaxis protein
MNLLARFAAKVRVGSPTPRSAVMGYVTRDILDRMSEPFAAINDRGKVLYANAAMSRLLDGEDPTWGKVHYSTLASHLGGDSFFDSVYETTMTGQPCFGDLTLPRGKGRYGLRVYPVEGGVHLFMTPIDPEAQTMQLGPARGEVGDPALLSDLSRELHNTVQSVLGASEFLLSPDQTQVDRLECVRAIRGQVARLGRMGVDLSELASFVREAPKLHGLTLPMGAFFDQLTTEWALVAKEHNLNFAMSSSGMIPSYILTDPVRLKQILWDILAHLVGHNHSGGVDIKVTCTWGKDERPLRMRFDLKDQLPGQPSDETWIARTIPVEGMSPFEISDFDALGGLWLRVARQVVSAMKGNLSILVPKKLGDLSNEALVETPNILGFALELSLGDQPTTMLNVDQLVFDPSGTSRIPTVGRRPLEGAHILVVEDSPDSQINLSRMLRLAGAEVHVVGSGLEGVELALAGAWHLILMDTHIGGGLDGYEAVRHLRQAGFDRPVVALAAKPSSAERRRVLVSGFDAYLPKPIDRVMLIEVVAEQIIRAGRAAWAQASELPPSDLLH